MCIRSREELVLDSQIQYVKHVIYTLDRRVHHLGELSPTSNDFQYEVVDAIKEVSGCLAALLNTCEGIRAEAARKDCGGGGPW